MTAIHQLVRKGAMGERQASRKEERERGRKGEKQGRRQK